MEAKKILKFTVIGLMSIGIAIWAYQYYGQKVFYVNTYKYQEASSSENVTVYTTRHANDIKLTTYQDYREIEIVSRKGTTDVFILFVSPIGRC